jgi:hypothetical protein
MRRVQGACGQEFDITARHLAIGVEGGALAAELDGQHFAAALDSHMHGDEQARPRALVPLSSRGLWRSC